MRKDVECTFGILKGRWRILKEGILLHWLKDADPIWKTCFAMHNLLLEVDGLDEKWEDGVISSWQGDLGNPDGTRHIPEAIRRLLTPSQARNYNTSGMGVGSEGMRTARAGRQNGDTDDDDGDESMVETNLDRHVVVGSLSMRSFRKRLITHFNIAFKRCEVKWPKRNGKIVVNVYQFFFTLIS